MASEMTNPIKQSVRYADIGPTGPHEKDLLTNVIPILSKIEHTKPYQKSFQLMSSINVQYQKIPIN